MKLKAVLDFRRIAGYPVLRLTAAAENTAVKGEYYIRISHNYDIASYSSHTNMKYDSFIDGDPSVQMNSIAGLRWLNIFIQIQRQITC